MISIAHEGNLERDITDGVLIERLMSYILPKQEDAVKGSVVSTAVSFIKKLKESAKK